MTAPHEVRARLTPSTVAQLAGALARAWRETHGAQIGRAELLCFLAQLIAENGWKGASIHNYNVGNAIHTANDGRNFSTWNGRPWRAFFDLDAGALDWVRLVCGRYLAAVQAAQLGNVEGYADAMIARGYVTAPEGPTYRRNVIGVRGMLSAQLPFNVADLADQGGGDYAPPAPIADEPAAAEGKPPPVAPSTSTPGAPEAPSALAPLALGLLGVLAMTAGEPFINVTCEPSRAALGSVGFDPIRSVSDAFDNRPSEAVQTFNRIEDLKGDYLGAFRAGKVTQQQLGAFGVAYNEWGDFWRSSDYWSAWHFELGEKNAIRLRQFQRRFDELRAVLVAAGATVRASSAYEGDDPTKRATDPPAPSVLDALPFALLVAALFGGAALVKAFRSPVGAL